MQEHKNIQHLFSSTRSQHVKKILPLLMQKTNALTHKNMRFNMQETMMSITKALSRDNLTSISLLCSSRQWKWRALMEHNLQTRRTRSNVFFISYISLFHSNESGQSSVSIKLLSVIKQVNCCKPTSENFIKTNYTH